MDFNIAWKVSFALHLIIAQGGFVFLVFYKYKNYKNSLIRAIILFFLWILSNIVCNGCPLTHLENNLFMYFYGKEIMPDYTFYDSWVYKFILK